MLHLPNASDDEDECLSDGPPEDALVGALARHAETLLTILSKTREKSETLDMTCRAFGRFILTLW